MLRGVKEDNYFIAFEIILMQRAMIQASYIMLTHVISLLLTLQGRIQDFLKGGQIWRGSRGEGLTLVLCF